MRVTTRFQTLAALGVGLAIWMIVLEAFVLLFGATAVLAWLLGQQYRFSSVVDTARDQLRIDQHTTDTLIATEQTTLVTVAVTATAPLPIDLVIEPSPPAGADTDVAVLSLARGETRAETTIEPTWPVAGSFTFESPTVTARDSLGLFEVTFETGSELTVTVEPRRPRNVHVGEGGDLTATGFGDHDRGQHGSGLNPEEVRKYIPGDTVRNIDWKATARLNEPHVREFEAETDRKTVLFVDHRATMGMGQERETKLDFAREVVLAFVESARERSDPLGCYTIGDNGLTGTFEPSADTERQGRVRRQLQAIEPTTPHSSEKAQTHSTQSPSAVRARTLKQRLADDKTELGQRIAPFFDKPNVYVKSLGEQPLFGAVQSGMTRFGGSLWSIIVTDDEHRTELREAVKLASRGERRVLVFLTPSVLFEPGGLSDLDTAYERYTGFERFRRDLASMDNVSAFEVGPADRFAAVIESGQQANRTQDGGK